MFNNVPYLMKYIYGPLKSRRLGMSLGVSLTPYKVCSFDCVYCQLGKTTEKTVEIGEYSSIEDIVAELKLWLAHHQKEINDLQYITLSGSGEPTLNIKIGRLIAEIKKIVSVPVAVITNASLLSLPEVRRALSGADLIVPSLDAVTEDVFARIDRPHEKIKIEDVIAGLVSLRKEFRGKIWLEVMLVRGLNDDLRHIRELQEVIQQINPDKIQLNSPVRATAEENVSAVPRSKLVKIKGMLGDKCEIV
ncbi:MAG: radical SAM protein [Candidatus Omnitrophica bacterium]|nr:radical SAM protein [Candidatus Omnitrophota bacterium]